MITARFGWAIMQLAFLQPRQAKSFMCKPVYAVLLMYGTPAAMSSTLKIAVLVSVLGLVVSSDLPSDSHDCPIRISVPNMTCQLTAGSLNSLKVF